MIQNTMPPIELAERLALLLALAFFLGLAFEETYKRDEPTIPAVSGRSRWSGWLEQFFIWPNHIGSWHLARASSP
jgi:hypothetical protein